jgi:hypothetical protein
MDQLIGEILGLDLEPSVFSVTVSRKDWQTYYTASATFRGEEASGVSAQGTTCGEALRKLKEYIMARHCPHCGALLKEKEHGQ